MRQNDVCTCKKYQKCIICLLYSLCSKFLLAPKCVVRVLQVLTQFLFFFNCFFLLKRCQITINFNFKVHLVLFLLLNIKGLFFYSFLFCCIPIQSGKLYGSGLMGFAICQKLSFVVVGGGGGGMDLKCDI